MPPTTMSGSGDTESALRLAGVAAAIAEDLGDKAPEELVIGLDPITLARERGVPADEVGRIVAEGRDLGTNEARVMAPEVARRA